MARELSGARRIIWIGGVIISLMFIIIPFVRIVLSVLDSNYANIGDNCIFAGYGILHLMTNGAYKANRKWGKNGLLTIYSIWIVYSLYKALSGPAEGLALMTAVVMALGSAVLITLILLSKSDLRRPTSQVT